MSQFQITSILVIVNFVISNVNRGRSSLSILIRFTATMTTIRNPMKKLALCVEHVSKSSIDILKKFILTSKTFTAIFVLMDLFTKLRWNFTSRHMRERSHKTFTASSALKSLISDTY